MKSIIFCTFLILISACSSSKGTTTVGTSESPKPKSIIIGQLQDDSLLVEIPFEEFDLLSSGLPVGRVDFKIDNDFFSIGINSSGKANLQTNYVEIPLANTAITPILLQDNKTIRIDVNSSQSRRHIGQISAVAKTSAQFNELKNSNTLGLIVGDLCQKIETCFNQISNPSCTQNLIVEKSLGDVLLESYGFDDSIDDNVSFLDLINGFESGQYTTQSNRINICRQFVLSRPCQGEETSISSGFNPNNPTDYTNMENILSDDGPCGRIVEIAP